MKKYFIFAAIAAAGLLTSCSSSDDAISENPNSPIENQGDRTPIKVDVGAPAANLTRGTGTVGSVAGSADPNAWHGQIINVFMFDQGTLNLALEDPTRADSYLYNNAPMYTPGTDKNLVTGMQSPVASGEAMITDGTINYYPINGNFDFFGYHADDAATGPVVSDAVAYTADAAADYNTAHGYQQGDAGYVTTADINPASATQWTIPFEIDGSQDLMSTKAALTEAQAAAMTGTRATDYYSAYSARKSPTAVQPVLTFKHLLSRLSFVAVAGNDKAAGCEVGAPTVTDITAAAYASLDDDGKAQCEPKNYTPKTGDAGKLTNVEYGDGTGVNAAWKADADDHSWTGDDPLDKADFDLLTAAEQAKFDVANYTRTQPGVATVTAENAVKINDIEVYSRTTGELVVAWKDPAQGSFTDADKISFTAADEQFTQTSVNGTDAKWLTLQERPTKKFMSTADPIVRADIEAYKTMTDEAYNALTEETTPKKSEVDAAVALARETISNNVYTNVLSAAGQAKYETIADSYQENLTTLTPTSPQIVTTEQAAADRYPETQIGEAMIVAPSAYNYIMKVNLSQKVKTNWDGTYETKSQTAYFTINAPANTELFGQDKPLGNGSPVAGFLQNVSYKIKLTVYGWERIIVTAVIEPWIEGETIPVGQD